MLEQRRLKFDNHYYSKFVRTVVNPILLGRSDGHTPGPNIMQPQRGAACKKASGRATKMLTERKNWVLHHCGFYKGRVSNDRRRIFPAFLPALQAFFQSVFRPPSLCQQHIPRLKQYVCFGLCFPP
ncbi:hypothetical protein DPMN_079590 [Dreissena polymorpha]|uniref:Uncharacterized protein n=1 Tax=Dreissena polymorpha TaxID=45954 RepID=A0A9D3YPB3_DREPO|nr:hypothetical protein DPMN_079590 [Dreissena polymorpha]